MTGLKIISVDEVPSKEVNWLWYPYIPYGKITIIQGDLPNRRGRTGGYH